MIISALLYCPHFLVKSSLPWVKSALNCGSYYAPVPPKDQAPILSATLNCGQSVKKKGKMCRNTESVLKLGIKFKSASGSLRRPHTVPDCSATKNRLSHFSGRFEPRSCRRHTDWVPGHLRPPGTKL